MSTALWFGMWHCHCTSLTAAESDIPDRCPTHEADLMAGIGGRRDRALDVMPGALLGYQSADHCLCPAHRPGPFEEVAG